MEIRLVGVGLFHVEGQKRRQTW